MQCGKPVRLHLWPGGVLFSFPLDTVPALLVLTNSGYEYANDKKGQLLGERGRQSVLFWFQMDLLFSYENANCAELQGEIQMGWSGPCSCTFKIPPLLWRLHANSSWRLSPPHYTVSEIYGLTCRSALVIINLFFFLSMWDAAQDEK